MRFLTTIAMAALVAACASEPTIQQGPDAEVTVDGLYRVDHAAFEHAYIDPDADWARYDQVLPGDAEFKFRAVKKTSESVRARSTAGVNEYYIDEDDRARLRDEVSAVFSEEVAKSERFSATDSAGPNVLVIRGGLVDIVSFVPPEYVGRGETFLSSVGEATLVIEVVDSMSGEVLFRAADRRAAERAGGTQPIRSSPATNWSEVRRLARSWGSTLREGLDSLPTS